MVRVNLDTWDRFFSKSSTYRKQELRDHLVDRYRQERDRVRAAPAIPSGMSREDIVFAAFRESLLPPHPNVATANAVDTLISYYFEACDVFDPYVDKDAPNASP